MRTLMMTACVLLALAGQACAQTPNPGCKTGDSPECRAWREGNCRKAIDEYLQVIAKVPTSDANDKKRNEAVQAKMHAAVREGRAKKLEECAIWGQLTGIAFTQ